MVYFTPPLINLAYARAHRGLQTAETSWDAVLYQFIKEASADFQTGLNRVCAPYTATQTMGINSCFGRMLDVDREADDLLAVTTLTNGDGSVLGASTYSLRPYNVYPKATIALEQSSGAFWSFPYTDSRITLAGTWGYVPHWGSHLSASGAVIPVGNLSDSATSVTLASGGGAFSVGDLIVVDSEWMLVTGVSSNTLTLVRAQLGTTAAAHTSGAAIYLYTVVDDIRFAVREMVVYYYKTKDQIGARVTVFDGGAVQVQDIDPAVDRIRKRHKRVPHILAV